MRPAVASIEVSSRFIIAAKGLPVNDPAGSFAGVCKLRLLLSDGTPASAADLMRTLRI